MASELQRHKFMSETEQRNVDYGMVIPGYIRRVIGSNGGKVASVIIDVCNKYVIPIKYQTESEDPINFISDNDKQISDKYKVEGNKYFKLKNYESAIIKYTTALRFNPNNHLIYCNRACCYYLLANYENALIDAKQCVNIRPTFYKGWLRYACILEKQNKYELAGISYKTAYNLSINWNINTKVTPKNPCKSYYTKFMKLLENTDRLDAIKYIHDFDKQSNANWIDSFDSMVNKFPQIKELMKMRENGAMNEENMFKFQQLMQSEKIRNELMQRKEQNDFDANIKHAKCDYFAQQNAFKFEEKENGSNGLWHMCCSRTPQIDNNKRIFSVNIYNKQGVIINSWLQHGEPTANQYIYTLIRAMTYSNLTRLECVKPKYIRIDDEMGKCYQAIKEEMMKFGIGCVRKED